MEKMKKECENDIDDVYEKCENLKDYFFFLIEKSFNGNPNELYYFTPFAIASIEANFHPEDFFKAFQIILQ